jgi:tRNA threonylcarbamoyladenosine biosynthesis protein TsaB
MNATFALVIETSTPFASLATRGWDGCLTERDFTSDRSHNAVLFSPLKELLDARAEEKIELVLVGSGPGSYSGTRVGIAAAQGVAIASSCPAVAIPSILAVPSAENGKACLAIGDARRGSYWTARMEDYRLQDTPQLTDLEGLASLVESSFAEGVSVISFEDTARFPLVAELQSRIRLEYPSAKRLWEAWEMGDAASRARWITEIPQPIYLKPPHITPAKRAWLV